MRFTANLLDVPINEWEPDADNTQTMREFIQTSEAEFGLDPRDLDSMTEEELNAHAEFLDYLWTK